MNDEEREDTLSVLTRVRKPAWDRLFQTEAGAKLKGCIDQADAALGQLGGRVQPRKVGEKVLDLLGDRLVSHKEYGEELRLMIIRSQSDDVWNSLVEAYGECAGARAEDLPKTTNKDGVAGKRIAAHWHQGASWARRFCELVGLPQVLAARRIRDLPEDELVSPVRVQPVLHDFQQQVYLEIRKLLGGDRGKSALLSLPTGAGKTRVAVEAVLDHLGDRRRRRRRDQTRNVVLWIAYTDELLRQAWQCFHDVWVVEPEPFKGKPSTGRGTPLRIVRCWGGRKASDIELEAEPTIILASIQQLAKGLKNRIWFQDDVVPRLACVIMDECHRIVTPSLAEILKSLGIRRPRCWAMREDSPPLLGLTATPWRTQNDESELLRKLFQSNLVTPASLGKQPVLQLQEREILARVQHVKLPAGRAVQMTAAQLARFETYRELQGDYLRTLGEQLSRNRVILGKLLNLEPERRTVLVFGCSVEHANLLALALNGAGEKAAVVTGETPMSERVSVLEAFKAGDIRFLTTCEVLTTGFDAPCIDTVCVARPTMSALLYEQMVGRGLRGKLNGGTEDCLVMDVQDKGLPDGVQSYGRVRTAWDGN